MEQGHIYIYGEIIEWQDDEASMWGCVNIKDVQKQMQDNKEAEELVVHINSNGGSVYEGFAIHDILTTSGKKITTQIEGMCASIATVIALAGDERKITENSRILIHNPWGMTAGDAKEMQKYADGLKEIEDKLANFYAEKTALTYDEAISYMKEESIFNSDKSKELGFVTDVITQIKAVAKLQIKTKNKMSEQITEEKLNGMFDNFLSKVTSVFKGGGAKALMLQDAEGVEIDFGADIEQESQIVEGIEGVKIDGAAASGDYVMPDGRTFTFEAGTLTKITEVEEPDAELEALKTENEELKAEVETLKGAQSKVTEELEAFKAEMVSKFKAQKPGTPPKKKENEPEYRAWKKNK